MNLAKSKYTAFLMNLILPGLGHMFWNEITFGLFVFLIMFIASVLLVVTLFLEFPFWGYLLIMALPAVFYFFSFFDLYKTMKTKRGSFNRSAKTVIIFLTLGLLFQLFVPVTPVNFGLRNAPDYFILKNNSLAPLYTQGNLIKASRLDYIVNLFFLDRPIMHHLPQRFDIVKFTDNNKSPKLGIILGLPGEQVEMFNGILAVNEKLVEQEPPVGLELSGYCELTIVDEYSIMIATLNLGTVDKIYQVSFEDLVGKVEKIF